MSSSGLVLLPNSTVLGTQKSLQFDFFKKFIYSRDKETQRSTYTEGIRDREMGRPSIHWFTSQMPTTAGGWAELNPGT